MGIVNNESSFYIGAPTSPVAGGGRKMKQTWAKVESAKNEPWCQIIGLNLQGTFVWHFTYTGCFIGILIMIYSIITTSLGSIIPYVP